MKPFSDTGKLAPEQHTYNYRLSSARSVVKMCFGRLKASIVLEVPLKKKKDERSWSNKMVLTCFVLHHICVGHGDNFTEEHPDRLLFRHYPSMVIEKELTLELH